MRASASSSSPVSEAGKHHVTLRLTWQPPQRACKDRLPMRMLGAAATGSTINKVARNMDVEPRVCVRALEQYLPAMNWVRCCQLAALIGAIALQRLRML